MRRHINVSLALILGLAVALSTTPLSAMQDDRCAAIEERVQEEFRYELDCESNFFEGLEVTSTPGEGVPYRFYDVLFTGEEDYETGAYIPERFNSEAMVVRVLTGSFAFRTQGSGVIVDPQGQPLERYIATIPIGLGEDPNIQAANVNESRVYDQAADDFPCELRLPDGRIVCLLDEAEFGQGNIFVRLDPGDTVYLPSNSTCFLCNTERIDSTPAEVLIWSSTTGFSEALETIAVPAQDHSLGTQGSGRIVGWMFNPGGRCN